MRLIKTKNGYKRADKVMEEFEANPIKVRDVKEDVTEVANAEYAQALRDRKKFKKIADKKLKTDMENATMKNFKLDKINTYTLDESLFTSLSLKENFDDEEISIKDVLKQMVDKFGNNKHRYELKAKTYERYEDGRKYTRQFYAPNDYTALFSMMLHGAPTARNFDEEGYDEFDMLDFFKDYPTYEDLLRKATSDWWGDGDDYIISLKNLTTGKTLYEADEEDEYSDDDYEW